MIDTTPENPPPPPIGDTRAARFASWMMLAIACVCSVFILMWVTAVGVSLPLYIAD